jgi:uncharacterized membrane protein
MDSKNRLASAEVSALQSAVRSIERLRILDQPSKYLERLLRPISEGWVGRALRGDWLGHSLHPPLTDVALGCWLGASLLDLFAGEETGGAATALVGVGLISALPTVLSGAAEWPSLHDRSAQRVAVVHAVGNSAVVASYLMSWLSRRSGRRKAGVGWGLAGGSLGLLTGYLGGHLVFGRGVGVGERWAAGPDLRAERVDADATLVDEEKQQ